MTTPYSGYRGNTRERGNHCEELVCEKLVQRGMAIVARNVAERFAAYGK